MIFPIILACFVLSQLYWFWRAWSFAGRRLKRIPAGLAVTAAVLALYASMFAYTFGWIGDPHTQIHLTPATALLQAPFLAWTAASMVASLVAILVSPLRYAARRLSPAVSPARRAFLGRTAAAITATPFAAAGYGLLYGRLDLQTPTQRIAFARLPRAFDGFRIAQLSDIHIGPFMTARQIREFATLANSLKPDLIVLTGDYVTWDPETQGPVVDALSGLRAPFGVLGCLGNHDAWAHVQDSLTRLFALAGIRILRHERAPIALHGDTLNLIGVDFQTDHPFGPPTSGLVRRYLEGVDALMSPGTPNILLSHNPNTFDRAAALGVDLSLAGHTHGGQAALEFISPELAPSRLVTPYVAGLFEKPGGRLYVNRGIGTIGVPIRIGAPPEITLFELHRG
jgi:predicted MPP superfamily phosphohydrolase